MPHSPPTPTPASIGRNIKAAREAAGLSQLALAIRIGQCGDRRSECVSGFGGSSYISRLEKGVFQETRVSTLQRVAEALGVGVDRLLLGLENGNGHAVKTKGGKK